MSLFQTRRQGPTESPLTFSLELKRLCSQSFPDLPQKSADQIVLHRFLEGLNEPLKTRVQLSVPSDLQSAINNSLRLDRPSLKLTHVEGVTRGQLPPAMRSRDLKPALANKNGYPSNRNYNPNFRSKRLNERETRPLIQPPQRPSDPPRAPRMLPPAQGTPSGAPKPKRDLKCYNCGGPHFIRECPKQKNV